MRSGCEGTYDTALESEGEGCCAVSELDRTAGVGVVISHGAQESGALNGKQNCQFKKHSRGTQGIAGHWFSWG